MNKYFVKVTQTYATKNKLQLAIYKALKEVNHTLLEKKHLGTFLFELEDKVKELNTQFPRCKPERLAEYCIEDGRCIYVEGVIVIQIYQVIHNA